MTRIEEIENQYKDTPIAEIERQIDEAKLLSIDNRIRQIELLYMLKRTRRFKENKRYAKSSFETYLMDRFNMRSGTFDKERKAIFGYREDVRNLGTGLVAKIIENCRRPEKVLKEINQAIARRKTPLPRQAIETIIQKHRKPQPAATPAPPQPTIQEIAALEAKIRNLESVLRKKEEQIQKLKTANTAKDKELRELRSKYENLLSTAMPIAAVIAGSEDSPQVGAS